MKVTVLSHSLSSNAVMRAHRLADAARLFADVRLVGPARDDGAWGGLPEEPWVHAVRYKRFPRFFGTFVELVDAADGDILIAVKPQLASFGAALVAAERRGVPVVLDLDDLDVAFRPRSEWPDNPWLTDLAQPKSAVYVSLLTKAVGAAAAITVASTALQQQFGGTLIPHGCDTELFDPDRIDRDAARRALGFDHPTVLFAGVPNPHKGLGPLAEAVSRLRGVRLAITCRETDLPAEIRPAAAFQRIPVVPYSAVPRLLAAADIVAIPQLDSEFARYQMPIKVFDAMAMAKPIVASAVSDLPLVLDGCGRLVPSGDVNRLAEAIADLLANPEEARRLGARARTRCVEEYGRQKIADRLSAVVSGVPSAQPMWVAG